MWPASTICVGALPRVRDYHFAPNQHAWEIELFVSKFGFDPAEALSAATRGGATMYWPTSRSCRTASGRFHRRTTPPSITESYC